MYRRLRRRTAPPAATGAAPYRRDLKSDPSEPATPDSSDSPSLTTTITAAASELSGLRSQIAGFSRRHGGGDDIVDDLELIVSELATNVIRHTERTEVTTTIRVDHIAGRSDSTDHRWTIEMTGARDVPGIDELKTPAVDQKAGRGLLIVRSIVDHVEIDREGDTVRCTLAG